MDFTSRPWWRTVDPPLSPLGLPLGQCLLPLALSCSRPYSPSLFFSLICHHRVRSTSPYRLLAFLQWDTVSILVRIHEGAALSPSLLHWCHIPMLGHGITIECRSKWMERRVARWAEQEWRMDEESGSTSRIPYMCQCQDLGYPDHLPYGSGLHVSGSHSHSRRWFRAPRGRLASLATLKRLPLHGIGNQLGCSRNSGRGRSPLPFYGGPDSTTMTPYMILFVLQIFCNMLLNILPTK